MARRGPVRSPGFQRLKVEVDQVLRLAKALDRDEPGAGDLLRGRAATALNAVRRSLIRNSESEPGSERSAGPY